MTFMSKHASRTPVPAIIGRRVLSAYIFSDEFDAHGVVLSLNDGSDLSIAFNYEARVLAEVVTWKSEDDAVSLQRVK